MSFLDKLIQIFKIRDLRRRILIVVGLLAVFRIAAAVPIPGVNLERLKALFSSEGIGQFLNLLNVFSGSALSNLSLVMLGVAPYITATIIMQLLTMLFPSIKEMYYEEGEQGRAKFNQWSRVITVPLALMQAYGFLTLLANQGVLQITGPFDWVRNILLVLGGSMFLMWVGELISEQKIGNGISLIIFGGIVARLPGIVSQTVITFDLEQMPMYLGFLIVAAVVIWGVVMVTEAERKIPVSYAKRVRGNRVFGGISTYLPMRLNQAGVIPIIFAISILLLPTMLGQVFALTNIGFLTKIGSSFSSFLNNQILYGISYFILVVLFTFFYTAITFEPKSISENLQKSGGFIPGIRPGERTADYLGSLVKKITFPGALFLGIIAILPLSLQTVFGVNQSLAIGGTSLLIVVSVALEILRQIESQLIIREYEGF